jgi:nitrite reductase (NADH) large subunit
VVVGNGMAGARLVEDVLRCGGAASFDIAMFGAEPRGNYNRILLSSVLAGAHDPRDILIHPLEWYETNQVRLHAGVPATRIDREARAVHGEGGVLEPYDKLVFATGSAPFVPPLDGLTGADGSPKSGIFVFRTLDDCAAISRRARYATRAAVIGGGLLGLEAARGLLNLGPEVHVVHLMPHLMETQLDAVAAEVLTGVLRSTGMVVHLAKHTRAILGDRAVEALAFEDGTTLDCDMVVIAAGIRPNVALARDAGLTVNRGIVVGDDLACPGDPAVFAVGECAEHRGRVYGLVGPLWEQTEVLADRLSGRRPDAAYAGSAVSTKLKVAGVELSVMGEKDARVGDELVTYAEPARGVYRKLVIREGRLAGAILVGEAATGPSLRQIFERESELPETRSDLLFPGAGYGTARGADGLPEDAQICHCNGVSKGRLLEAIEAGCASVAELGEATRAGTGCGSCQPQILEILAGVVTGGPVAPLPLAEGSRNLAANQRTPSDPPALVRALSGEQAE